jgi:hypothetical protein
MPLLILRAAAIKIPADPARVRGCRNFRTEANLRQNQRPGRVSAILLLTERLAQEFS